MAHPLLAVARRCHSTDMHQYLPVIARGKHVGHISKTMAEALKPFLGDTLQMEALAPDSRCDGRAPDQAAVILAPNAKSTEEASSTLATLVSSMVAEGIISSASLRHELQDIRPLEQLCLSEPPIAQIERAAMAHFGIPAHAVHINGWVPGGEDGSTDRMWVGVRSATKSTYPGCFDQMVAGGQPSGLSYRENAEKECSEEACVPAELLEPLVPTGQVCYRYASHKGLSTGLLTVYDLALPKDFVPSNSDQEVDAFILMTIPDVISSIGSSLERWKPNSALTVLDFAIRHGHISPDTKGYPELCRLTGAGLI
ncbi:unnamed protein product [Chrysoparadoxa australica]